MSFDVDGLVLPLPVLATLVSALARPTLGAGEVATCIRAYEIVNPASRFIFLSASSTD